MLENNKTVISTTNTDKIPTAVAISINGKELAVGFEDASISFYLIKESKGLSFITSATGNKGEITSISYSPDGKYVAASDSQRSVIVYECATKVVKFNEWIFHTSRVNSIHWSLDSTKAVSGSVDASVEIWNIDSPMKHICIKGINLFYLYL